MSIYSSDISLLEGEVIIRINVEAGFIEFELEDGRIFSLTPLDNGVSNDTISEIEGSLEDLIDGTITVALYDHANHVYIVETSYGEVVFRASGPETGVFQVSA